MENIISLKKDMSLLIIIKNKKLNPSCPVLSVNKAKQKKLTGEYIEGNKIMILSNSNKFKTLKFNCPKHKMSY